MKLLSILIPSLTVREKKLNQLIFNIEKQLIRDNLYDDIEIVTFVDNFENSIGHKRNALLERSSGKFTCFVDDDDVISSDYCYDIVESIKANDIQHVGFKVKVFFNGKERKPAYHSIQYSGWYHNVDGYYRQTSTLNPILSSISKSVKFCNINDLEDRRWVEDIVKTGLLREEVFIDKFLYEYFFNKSTSLSGDRRSKNFDKQYIDWEVKPINIEIIEIK